MCHSQSETPDISPYRALELVGKPLLLHPSPAPKMGALTSDTLRPRKALESAKTDVVELAPAHAEAGCIPSSRVWPPIP